MGLFVYGNYRFVNFILTINSLICILKFQIICHKRCFINKKILLTGVRSLFTLDLARRFNERCFEIYTAETSPFHVCRFSNAIKKHFTIPSPRFESKKFISALVKIAIDEKIDLLIPSFEEIFCISQNLHLFPNSCQVFCSNYSILDSLHNKWAFNKKIEKLGFLTPKSFLVRTEKDLVNNSLAPPYILKPCYSRAAQQIIKVDSKKIPKLNINPNNPFVAQEWLQGKKYCTYSISQNGQITAHVVYPVDYSIDGNSCLNFTSIEHPQIEEWVTEFVSKEKFNGQIAFDFIEVYGKGLYAIECNPRGTSGIHLYQKKDNLPSAFFCTNQKPIFPQKKFSKQIALGMMLYGWRSLKNPKAIFHFLKYVFTIKDVIFSISDIKPFLFQPLLLLFYLYKTIKLKTCLPSMFTFDIDWNGNDLVKIEQKSYQKIENN